MNDNAQKSTGTGPAASPVCFEGLGRLAVRSESANAPAPNAEVCGTCARWDGTKCAGNCRNDLGANSPPCAWFAPRVDADKARIHALEREQSRIAHALGVAPDADLVAEAHAVMARLANADAERGALMDEAEERQDDLEAARQRAGLAEQQLRLVGFALRVKGVGGTSVVGQARAAAEEIGRLRVAVDRAAQVIQAAQAMQEQHGSAGGAGGAGATHDKGDRR